jgi:hypothetical protein
VSPLQERRIERIAMIVKAGNVTRPSATFGIDPTLIALGAQVAAPVVKDILGAIFGNDDAAKAAQLQALLIAQQQAKAAEMRRWLIAGGVLAVGVVLVVALRR